MSKYPIKKEFFPFNYFKPPISKGFLKMAVPFMKTPNYVYKDKACNSIGPCTSGIYVTEINGLYGYKWKTMSGTIEPAFEQAKPFIDSYAAVYKDDEWYFIDSAGDRVLATKDKIEELYSFSQGLAVARIDGKYGFVDKNFSKYMFEYEDATNFYYGVAALKKDGKWALINSSFEWLTGFEFALS